MDHLELVADCSNDPRARARVCVFMVGSRGVVAWCWKPKYLGRFLTVRNVAELLGILDSEEKGLFLDPRIVSQSKRAKDSL